MVSLFYLTTTGCHFLSVLLLYSCSLFRRPIPAAALFEAWVCGHSLAGNAGSNTAAGIHVSLLWVLCVVR